MKNITEELKGIVAEIIGRKPDEIDLNAKFIGDLGMDSFMSIEMIVAIEARYGIEISEESFSMFTTLGRVIEAVEGYLSKENG